MEKNETQWITNKVKKTVTKRDRFFHKLVTNPTVFKRDGYRKQFSKIYHTKCKKEANFKKLGTNPFARTIYRTLKNLTRSNQQREWKLDIDMLKRVFHIHWSQTLEASSETAT